MQTILLVGLGIAIALLMHQRPWQRACKTIQPAELDGIPGPLECESFSCGFHELTLTGSTRTVRKSHISAKGPTREHWNLLALHRKYGAIVRIGPLHVSVADFDSVNAIYRQATPFLKTAWYDLFTERGKSVLFTIQNKTIHAKRRRIVGHAFSQSSTRAMLPFIRTKALRTLSIITQRAAHSLVIVDVAPLMRHLAGDVSLKLSLGLDLKQVEEQTSSQLVDDLVARGAADGATRALASHRARWGPLLSTVICSLWHHSGDWNTASRINRADKVIRASVDAFQKRVQSSSAEGEERELLRRIIEAKDPTTGQSMAFDTLCREARGFILAASDTTANTLTMAIHHIARDEQVWARLHRELKEAIPTRQDLQEDFSYYTNLPFLSACIKETQRLTPAIARLLPRHVPAGGALLAGHHVPAGAIVGTSIFVQHRWQEEFWGSSDYADRFHPERWLLAASSSSPTASEVEIRKRNAFL